MVHTLLQHVFGHGAVGCPFAASHRDQARTADNHGVFAAQGFGVVAIALRRFDQGTQTDPNAFDIWAPRCALQIARRLLQDEVDFGFKSERLARQIVTRCVGGAQDHLAQPRHGKQHAAIGGFGHHQGLWVGPKTFVHHQVHALTGGHHGLRAAVLLAQRIHPHPRGIDHATRLNLVRLAGEGVGALQASHLAFDVEQAFGPHAVEQQGPLAHCAARQRQRQLGIVELPVPILHAATQSRSLHRWQASQRVLARQKLGVPQTGCACQGVVHLQADAVKRLFPPRIGGHDKGQRLGQVRGVAQQGAALMQGFAHQIKLALGQIPHAAVHQLGRPRRGAFGKVIGFHQDHAVTARGRVQGQTQARGATAHNGQVIGGVGLQLRHEVSSAGGQGWCKWGWSLHGLKCIDPTDYGSICP